MVAQVRWGLVLVRWGFVTGAVLIWCGCGTYAVRLRYLCGAGSVLYLYGAVR